MRRFLISGCGVVLFLIVAAPTSAKQDDVVKFNETYSIPEDVADVGDPGASRRGRELRRIDSV